MSKNDNFIQNYRLELGAKYWTSNNEIKRHFPQMWPNRVAMVQTHAECHTFSSYTIND